jgi:hypothetical protein
MPSAIPIKAETLTSLAEYKNCSRCKMLLRTLQLVSAVAVVSAQMAAAQVDPPYGIFQLGRSQALARRAPQASSPNPHFENRAFLLTNTVLFLDSATPRIKGRTSSSQFFLPNTNHPTILVKGELLDSQSNFQGERVEPSLWADVRRFDQPLGWRIGGGGILSYGFPRLASRIVIHCGSSFKPPREAFEGERCFGLLFRFDLGKNKPVR